MNWAKICRILYVSLHLIFGYPFFGIRYVHTLGQFLLRTALKSYSLFRFTMTATILLNAFFVGYCITSVAAGDAGAGATAKVNLGKELLAPIQVYEVYQKGTTTPTPGLSPSVNNALLQYNTQIAKIFVSALNQLITFKNQGLLSIVSAAKAKDVNGIEKAYANFIQQAGPLVNKIKIDLLNITLNLKQNWKPNLQFNEVYVIVKIFINVFPTNARAIYQTLEYGLQNIVNGFQTGTSYGQIVVNVEFAAASALTNILAAVLTGINAFDTATADILFLQNVGSGWNVIAAAVYIGVNVSVSLFSVLVNAFTVVLTTIKTAFIVILLVIKV